MTIQEEIKTGLKNIKLHKWRYDGGETVFFLNDNDVQLVLQYLDSKGVAVRVCEKGETAWAKIPYEYCKWERLVEK